MPARRAPRFVIALLLPIALAFAGPAAPSQQVDDEALERSIEELRTSLGTWDVTTEFLHPDGSVAQSVDGTYEFSWVVPDRVLSGKSELPSLGQSSGILFYLDPTEREVEMVSVGADGQLWVMTGPLGGDTRETREFVTPTGEVSQLRFTRSNVTDDSFESHMERRVTDAAGAHTWVPANHQIFERRPAARTAVVYLVRHAEPDYASPEAAQRDPVLGERGRRRAEQLARVLASDGIDRVLSTETNRTRETAAPVAQALGVDIEPYDYRALDELASSLGAGGERVLVVGHSNTTPTLVGLLGGDAGAPIDEATEFDRLYVVSVAPDGSVSTTLLRYGEPTPEDWRATDEGE